jgi:uncharacterized protein
MGKRSSHAPGTFSWADLATGDPGRAKEFYAGLFGWDYSELDAGGGATYIEASVGGDAVAGLYEQAEGQAAEGAPASWRSYVTVESSEATAWRADELGGDVRTDPHDVGDAGRMAVLADPTGAIFGIWEPRESIGAHRVNDPGCMTWNELSTTEPGTAIDFYSSLFGWRIQPLDTGGGPPYWSIGHEGAASGRNGSMRELSEAEGSQGVPPNWMPYFTVESAAATSKRAASAGGSVIAAPLDIPTGRIAVLRDPEGAALGIFEGDVDE